MFLGVGRMDGLLSREIFCLLLLQEDDELAGRNMLINSPNYLLTSATLQPKPPKNSKNPSILPPSLSLTSPIHHPSYPSLIARVINSFNSHFILNFIHMQANRPSTLDLNELHFQDQSEIFSPKMNRQSQVSGLTPKMLEKCNFISQFEYLQLFQILQKSHGNRTHNELRFLNEFIKKNLALKELSDLIGKQFCKGIMRTALIQEYDRDEIICQRGSEVSTVYIIVQGKAASIKNEDETDMIQHIKQREVYEILMNASRREVKKINKLQRKFSSWRDDEHNYREKYERNGEEQFLEYFQKGQTFGDKVRCFGKDFPHTIIAVEKSLILSVDMKNVIFWLNHSFELKLEKLYKQLKNHPFFEHVSNQTLEEIISYMSVHKRKKNETIYQQGQQSTHIYFLEEGEMKIEKECHLFVDNPNELYIDRRKLMNKREIHNKQYLPYANLEKVYNYRPISKVIELGILTPFCIFGEEELTELKRRETTIRCSSLHAFYYSLQIKRIYQILGDNMITFLQAVKASIKEKIRYRQSTYANAMSLENKNNLKYFYFQGEQELPTPRKYILKKINEKICEHSNMFEPRAKDTSTIYSESVLEDLNPESRVRFQLQDKGFEGPIPPLYNTFNFHKMMKTKLLKSELTKLPFEDQDSEEIKQEDKDKDFKLKFKEQLKQQHQIIANSHTWRLVRQKVKQENKISKRIGSFKYDINFVSPLIDTKYFQDIETEMKRISREKKAGKFNVSTPKRKRANSVNYIMINK